MAESQSKMAALQGQLQTESREFQRLEGVVEARQRLDAQQSENEQVLKELVNVKPHNTVYKLMGPGLLPQDPAEAKANVEKRLEYIRSEIKRVEGQIKEHEDRTLKKKEEIISLQREFQALQGPSKA